VSADPRPDRVARQVLVRGHVQGVSFRDSARRVAERHGVAGWVANRDDGAVEAVLEGPSDDVEAVIDQFRQGPRGASVERVEVRERDVEGLTGFQAR
jgi:acylphosphatase